MDSYICRWCVVFFCIAVSHIVSSHREHKVHNIVLYPDKHSWCKTTPIKQVVAYPDCTPLEIDNNVCVGQCFSYSIPCTIPSAPGEVIKPYCDSCQPSNVTWQNVTLTCNGIDVQMQKSVQTITNCSCITCDSSKKNLEPTEMTFTEEQEIPEKIAASEQLINRMGEAQVIQTGGQLGLSVYNDTEFPASGDSESSQKQDDFLEETDDTDQYPISIDKEVDGQPEISLDGRETRKFLKDAENPLKLDGNLSDVVNCLNSKCDVEKLARNQQEYQESNEKATPISHNPEQHRHHHGEHDGKAHGGKYPHHLGLGASLDEAIQEETVDPTIDVPSHQLRPALAGQHFGYHENLQDLNKNGNVGKLSSSVHSSVIDNNEEQGNDHKDIF